MSDRNATAVPGPLGGKNIYGVDAGILLLETPVPRIPGDVGNARTWPYPVHYRVVRGVTPERVLPTLDRDYVLPLFTEAALALEQQGVAVVGAGCGFTIALHEEIQDRLTVPFVSSSLLQIPGILAMLAKFQSLGILTIRKASLTPSVLSSAGLRDFDRVSVYGMDDFGGYFSKSFIGNATNVDFARVRREHISAAQSIMQQAPNTGALLLECTNMPPYAGDIQRVTGVPVYDFTTALNSAVHAAVRPPFGRTLPGVSNLTGI